MLAPPEIMALVVVTAAPASAGTPTHVITSRRVMPIHPNCCESSSAPMPTTAPPSAPSRMPRRQRMARAIPNPSSATPATTATLPTAPVTVANGDRPVKRTQIVWSQLPDVTWTRYRPTPYGATR